MRARRRPREEELPALSAADLGLTPAAQLAAEALEQPEEEESEDDYEPMPLKTRRKELKLLGKPGDRDHCFLCSHKGERDSVPVPRKDLAELIDFMRDNFGRMKQALLAITIADRFEQIRQRVNAKRRPGEQMLRPMTAATVLSHFRGHVQDPEWKQIVTLEELQEAREELMGMLFERKRKSKRKRPNRAAFQCLDQVVKLEWLVQSKDPAKMALYAAGARVSAAARTQGPVSVQNKNLYEFFEKRARE